MAAAGSPNLNYGYPTPGPQDPTAAKVMDHVFFMSEEEWKAAREVDKFDLVIVGTGFCGLAVAQRALKNEPGLRILMIERGPFFLPEHFQNLPLPMKETLGGKSETFPWTLAASTANGKDGPVTWQHGQVNFFGGRSTLWSAWCPEPTSEELDGWPQEVKNTLLNNPELFMAAKELLDVRNADAVDSDACTAYIYRDNEPFRPVYRNLQLVMQRLLEAEKDKEDHEIEALRGLYRAQAAPLASGSRSGVDFEKFSTPSKLLELLQKHPNLQIVTRCTVRRILKQGHSGRIEDGTEPDAVATALDTSRGVLALHNAKLVLAMGTLPPVTLIRNSFPELAKTVGQRFSAHFITAIAARVKAKEFVSGQTHHLPSLPKAQSASRPTKHKDCVEEFEQLELGACYVAGTAMNGAQADFKKQYHVQLTALYDEDPAQNARKALRYMPDVVATASPRQLSTSKDHVVFICAVLGEMDHTNKEAKFLGNDSDADPTTNSILRMKSNGDNDIITWKAMDDFTFAMLENVLAREPGPRDEDGNATAGEGKVEYWHGGPDNGEWKPQRPSEAQYRVPATVHEGSTLHIGSDKDAPVDLDYRLKHVANVYITGAGLWPQGGSWNPTLCMVALAMDLADKLFPAPRLGAPRRMQSLSPREVVNAFDTAANVYMCIKDRDSHFLWANTNFAKLVGKQSPDELVGTYDLNGNHTTDDKLVLQDGRSFKNKEETILAPPGQPVEIRTQKGPLYQDGDISGVTVCFSESEVGGAEIGASPRRSLNATSKGGGRV